MSFPVRIKILFFLAALIALGPLASAQPVWAHAASYGYAKWHVADKRAEWTMAIDGKSIMELGPIDANNDGSLAREEAAQSYETYIRPYMDDKLIVSVNGKNAAYALDSLDIASDGELQMTFHLDSRRTIETFQVNYRLFFEESKHRHKNISVFYLPDNPDLPVEHIFKSDTPAWEWMSTKSADSANSFPLFIMLGIEHIMIGYDHILFILSLLVIGLRFRSTIAIVTAFTAAHSITLALSALGAVRLPPAWIEIAIALTICYVAAENMWKRQFRHRWMLTFAFGLIHGFGFANVLENIAVPGPNLVLALLGFNLGVEIGQLLLIAMIVPVMHVVRKFNPVPFRRVTVGVSAILFLCGLLWAIERAYELAR
ncbi:HupE/UreJ family protein [Paenibacillus tarimensis]